MFYYFGGKRRLAKLYPAPQYDTIIEPFAGSAQYSIRYGDRNVILIEKDERVCRLWRYLQGATPKEILSLPIPERGKRIDGLGLETEEEDLIRAHAAPGARTGYVVGPFSKWNENKRSEIARLVTEIRHWKILNGSYEQSPDIPATWFIDPPYQFGGKQYRCSSKDIDYAALLQWCDSRLGQVIVCENSLNQWLPSFEIISTSKNIQNRKSADEVVYLAGARPEEKAA